MHALWSDWRLAARSLRRAPGSAWRAPRSSRGCSSASCTASRRTTRCRCSPRPPGCCSSPRWPATCRRAARPRPIRSPRSGASDARGLHERTCLSARPHRGPRGARAPRPPAGRIHVRRSGGGARRARRRRRGRHRRRVLGEPAPGGGVRPAHVARDPPGRRGRAPAPLRAPAAADRERPHAGVARGGAAQPPRRGVAGGRPAVRVGRGPLGAAVLLRRRGVGAGPAGGQAPAERPVAQVRQHRRARGRSDQAPGRARGGDRRLPADRLVPARARRARRRGRLGGRAGGARRLDARARPRRVAARRALQRRAVARVGRAPDGLRRPAGVLEAGRPDARAARAAGSSLGGRRRGRGGSRSRASPPSTARR